MLTETESKKRARSDSDNSEVKPVVEATAETPATEKKKKKKVFEDKSFPRHFSLIYVGINNAFIIEFCTYNKNCGRFHFVRRPLNFPYRNTVSIIDHRSLQVHRIRKW